MDMWTVYRPPNQTVTSTNPDDISGRMQTLTLHPGESTKTDEAAELTATTDYDYSRDTSAQPSNAWSDHDQAYDSSYYYGNEYYDPYNYQYGYGSYDSEVADGADYPEEGYAEASDEQDPAGARTVEPSAGLCSQYLASGQCSKGSKCRLVHGDLCQVKQLPCLLHHIAACRCQQARKSETSRHVHPIGPLSMPHVVLLVQATNPLHVVQGAMPSKHAVLFAPCPTPVAAA